MYSPSLMTNSMSRQMSNNTTLTSISSISSDVHANDGISLYCPMQRESDDLKKNPEYF